MSVLAQFPLRFRAKALTLLPNVFRPAIRFLPFVFQEKLLLSTLHSVFKDAVEDGDFEFLQDKWLKIDITDLALNWWISYDGTKLIMLEKIIDKNADVTFSANGDDLLLIAGRKQDPDTLFFQRRLNIEGDTELGLEVKNLIDSIELEQLPYLVHRLISNVSIFIESTQRELKDAV